MTRIVVMLGPPGAGKGTLARQAAGDWGFETIAVGDVLRRHIAAGDEIGRVASLYSSRGLLVPDDLVMDVIRGELDRMKDATAIVFDGAPRTLVQAQKLDKLLAGRGLKVDAAVVLEAEDATLMERLGGRCCCGDCGATYHRVTHPPKREAECDDCGGQLVVRRDDQPEIIRNRIATYKMQTAPVLPHYEAEGRLHRFQVEQGQAPLRAWFDQVLDGVMRAPPPRPARTAGPGPGSRP